MTSKMAAVLTDEHTSWPMGAVCSQSVMELENSSAPVHALSGALPMPDNLSTAEHYQVALIPLPRLMSGTEKDTPIFTDLHSVVVLPLTWKDLVTRLQSPSSPSKSRQNSEVIIFGSVSVKLSSMEVHRSGSPIALTPLEFKLLRYLVLNPNRVISRDELLNEVWGFDNYPCTRTVDTHMWRLRQKLETDPAKPDHFHTVHAMGYKFLP
jgi:DNA-binding winged helix-turn-helix (wHTH) protein